MARGKKATMEATTQVDAAPSKVPTSEQSSTVEPATVSVEPAFDPLASMRVAGDADVLLEEDVPAGAVVQPAVTTVTGPDLGPTPVEEAEHVVVQSSAAIPPPISHEMVVQNKVTISWGAQMITLHPGQRVSDSSYGDGALQRMMAAGVKLKYPDE